MLQAKSCPVISNIGINTAPQILDPPSIIRNQTGEIIITPVDAESGVYFTLDGSPPDPDSKKYSGPFQIERKLVDQGEFSNIKNNPLWQIKKFAPVKARYIKFRALAKTRGNNKTGYAEVDVIME
jgi:hypothetical protein